MFEALHERLHMLRAAPHLTNPIPTMMPCYKLWEVRGSRAAAVLSAANGLAVQVPYFWAGLKAYDAVAGTSALAWSHYLSATASREIFPTLLPERPDGDTLKGSVSGWRAREQCCSLCSGSHVAPQIVYYDGQMNDARVNIALATTAAMAGAVMANHVTVVSLTKASCIASAAP